MGPYPGGYNRQWYKLCKKHEQERIKNEIRKNEQEIDALRLQHEQEIAALKSQLSALCNTKDE